MAGVISFIPFSTPKEICHPIARWDGAGAGWRLDHPMDLAWRDSVLYVADAENGSVKKIRDDGTLIAEWKGFKRPVDVAAVQGAVYVVDFLADRVVKLGLNGTVVGRWGRHGHDPGEFDAPSGIAVDGKGYVYVAEFYNHRIQKFTADGTFVAQWGSDGRWNGQLHYPTDVAVDAAGAVFVADAYNHRIEKFTENGAYVDKWGGVGFGLSGKWPGWFRLAKAVAVDSAGNIYVADAFNRRIQKFTPDGRLLGVWGNRVANDPGPLRYPAGVATDTDGHLYVTDFFENRIWKLDCR
ncbi:MAG: hypothetical protein Q7W02_16095 [Candidatus Rokubacteria bacterium]|nr:hypothetical protein [Candidatus Rokubacteria bacterium]